MMLFKSQQKYLDSLRSGIQESMDRLQLKMEEIEEAGIRQEKHLEDLGQSMEKNSKAVQTQGMSLEDLIEIVEQNREQESLERERIRELEEDRQNLISMIVDYQEIIWQLKAASSCGNTPWMSQLDMAEQKIRGKMESAGMDLLGREGESVNYDYHQVLNVEDTNEAALHGTVKQVFSPGCRFRGKVIKKCSVSAWRCLR